MTPDERKDSRATAAQLAADNQQKMLEAIEKEIRQHIESAAEHKNPRLVIMAKTPAGDSVTLALPTNEEQIAEAARTLVLGKKK